MTGQTNLFSFVPDYRTKAIIILASCLVLNLNILQNTYALDDEMVISKNVYMRMGFGGIKTILQNDAYQGFLDEMGDKNRVFRMIKVD